MKQYSKDESAIGRKSRDCVCVCVCGGGGVAVQSCCTADQLSNQPCTASARLRIVLIYSQVAMFLTGMLPEVFTAAALQAPVGTQWVTTVLAAVCQCPQHCLPAEAAVQNTATAINIIIFAVRKGGRELGQLVGHSWNLHPMGCMLANRVSGRPYCTYVFAHNTHQLKSQ